MGIQVSEVETAQEARAIVRLAKYPPIGNRGISGQGPHTGYKSYGARHASEYAPWANENIIICPSIEWLEGLENVEGRCVPGQSARQYEGQGPMDFAAFTGTPGGMPPMAFVRCYTGTDGQSHFEDLDLLPPDMERSIEQAASSITFTRSPNGRFSDWHNAPRRQYAIFLSGGQMEVVIGDGTTRRFGPGDAVLFEDLTGQGHTSRSVGGDRLTAIVPLAD